MLKNAHNDNTGKSLIKDFLVICFFDLI